MSALVVRAGCVGERETLCSRVKVLTSKREPGKRLGFGTWRF